MENPCHKLNYWLGLMIWRKMALSPQDSQKKKPRILGKSTRKNIIFSKNHDASAPWFFHALLHLDARAFLCLFALHEGRTGYFYTKILPGTA